MSSDPLVQVQCPRCGATLTIQLPPQQPVQHAVVEWSENSLTDDRPLTASITEDSTLILGLTNQDEKGRGRRMTLKRVLMLLICIVEMMVQGAPEVNAAPKKGKTTCIHTGNAYFFKRCSKKTKKCWLEYGIQYFMYNWKPQTRRFTFRCTLRYGRGLRKQQVRVAHIVLKPTVNCLGGVVFTWPGILVDKVKKRYKYRCTCKISGKN